MADLSVPSEVGCPSGSTYVVDVEWSRLVDLVDPVPVKQMRMAAPSVLGRLRWIIVRIIVDGNIDRRAGFDIAVVFLFQRVPIIFEMVEYVDRAMGGIFDKTGSDFVAAQECRQAIDGSDFILFHLCPTADRNDEIVRETPQVGRGRREVPMPETPECLVLEYVLLDAVHIVDHRHAAPADAKG